MSRRERITKELLVEPGTDASIAGPEVSDQARAANTEARRKLAAEPDDETGRP